MSERQELLGKWDRYLQYNETRQDLNPEEKTRLRNGFLMLKTLFDDSWLWNAAEQGHPLIHYLSNRAPWSHMWLAGFAENLASIQELSGSNKLLLRLKDPDQFSGAECEVDSASRFSRKGYRLSLDPASIGKRKADIKVDLGKSELFIEITRLQPSLKEMAASSTAELLSMPFFHAPELLTYCQIYKILSPPHIMELRDKILHAFERVKTDKTFAYINEPRVIDYLIIHKDYQEKPEVLTARYKIKPECSGPPIPVEDIRRVEAKIWDKVQQLPTGKPGVIVIYANLTYFSGDPENFYDKLSNEIEEAIYAQPDVVLGIIIGTELGTRNKENFTCEKENYFIRTLSRSLLLIETQLFIKNRYSKLYSQGLSKNIIEAYST
jgi:hypothetical protein